MSSFQESKIETNVHTLVNKKPRKLGMVLLTFKGHVDSNFFGKPPTYKYNRETYITSLRIFKCMTSNDKTVLF